MSLEPRYITVGQAGELELKYRGLYTTRVESCAAALSHALLCSKALRSNAQSKAMVL